MVKCDDEKTKQCKSYLKKCGKPKGCDCGKKEEQRRGDPKMRKEDLLWSYFAFKMINEALSDSTVRNKIKDLKLQSPDGTADYLELATLREAFGLNPKSSKDNVNAGASTANTSDKTASGSNATKP